MAVRSDLFPERIVAIDRDGETYTFRMEPGPSGRFMPPVGISTSPNIGQAGDRVDQVRHDARTVSFPIWVEGATWDECRAELRGLAELLDPVRGFIRLRTYYPDGSARELRSVLYSSGLEGDETAELAGTKWMRAVPAFLAADPYYYDPIPVSRLFVQSGIRPFFPLLPLRLSRSSVFGQNLVIVNEGTQATWPEWTFQGPWTRIELHHRGTGKTLVYGAAGSSSAQIKVDTRPGEKTIVDETGLNRWADVDPAGMALWPLHKGENLVDVLVLGASVGTQVRLRFEKRFLTS